MLNFTAIDFETANIQRSSVFCWFGKITRWSTQKFMLPSRWRYYNQL